MNLFEVFVFTYFLSFIAGLLMGFSMDYTRTSAIIISICVVLIDAWYKVRIEGIGDGKYGVKEHRDNERDVRY